MQTTSPTEWTTTAALTARYATALVDVFGGMAASGVDERVLATAQTERGYTEVIARRRACGHAQVVLVTGSLRNRTGQFAEAVTRRCATCGR